MVFPHIEDLGFFHSDPNREFFAAAAALIKMIRNGLADESERNVALRVCVCVCESRGVISHV